MSEELRTAKATWFCSSCMSFKEHTDFKMISEELVEGECECGKKTLQFFPKHKKNDLFGLGRIDIV